MTASPQEFFKPVSVRYTPTAVGRAMFALRCLADLQLGTLYAFLRAEVPGLSGAILDVGCGESPYRHLISAAGSYTGVDIDQAASFGMRARPDIVAFDGINLPFPDQHFDHVLCTEVLEHAADPAALVRDIHRVLKPSGTLIVTVPFSARVHHAPYDFQRFTQYGLQRLFGDFARASIAPRGSDITAIAAKVVVRAIVLAAPPWGWSLLWRVPALVVVGPLALVALVVAHLALYLGAGSADDPLGYNVICRR